LEQGLNFPANQCGIPRIEFWTLFCGIIWRSSQASYWKYLCWLVVIVLCIYIYIFTHIYSITCRYGWDCCFINQCFMEWDRSIHVLSCYKDLWCHNLGGMNTTKSQIFWSSLMTYDLLMPWSMKPVNIHKSWRFWHTDTMGWNHPNVRFQLTLLGFSSSELSFYNTILMGFIPNSASRSQLYACEMRRLREQGPPSDVSFKQGLRKP
jgi:hypothetical protein